MITERGGGAIDDYLADALAILSLCEKARAALQYEFLKQLRTAQLENTMLSFVGGKQSRTEILLSGTRIREIWDANQA